jgi:hypothetical protein
MITRVKLGKEILLMLGLLLRETKELLWQLYLSKLLETTSKDFTWIQSNQSNTLSVATLGKVPPSLSLESAG